MSNVVNNDKVLFLITASYPFGKTETFIETEIQYLPKAFRKIVIISHDVHSNHKRELTKNIEVIRIPYNLTNLGKLKSLISLFDKKFWIEIQYIKKEYNKRITFGILKTMFISLANAKRLSRIYKNIINIYGSKNALLYSYWSNDSALALSLLKLKDQNIACISRVHGWDVFFESSKYNYLPYRTLLNKSNGIYSISQKGIDYAKNIWKIHSNNVFLSRLGVKGNKFKVSKEKLDFLMVSCSNIIELKRVSLIIKALSLITKVNVKWVHFGDGDLMNMVKLEAKSFLPNNITYEFTGRISNKEVLTYYQNNNPDLFINVSSSEGVPVSIMEAMSCGIPIIATNVGGTSEIVNIDNGYLLSSNPRPMEVASKISEYYKLSIIEKNNKREAAYNTWKEKFNANKNYTKFINDLLFISQKINN